MGRYFNLFSGKNQFLFHESKLFHHGIQYLKNTSHPRWEVRQIIKIAIFSAKPIITLTSRYSSINPVTNKSYFGILIRIANETGCQSLIDNDDNILFGANILKGEM